jgi:hypothetical protein
VERNLALPFQLLGVSSSRVAAALAPFYRSF